MSLSYKPDTYPSVAPYLVVDDAAGTIDFLLAVFGATELRRYEGDDGKIRHAEVRIDDAVVMLGESLEGWPAMPANVHVYVPDVDAVYQKALTNGAVSVQEPVQKGDADKRGGVKDAFGTTWWISTQVG